MPLIVRHVVADGKDVSVRQDRLADPHRNRIPTAAAVRHGDPICPVGGERALAHLLRDAWISRFNQDNAAFRIGEKEEDFAAAVVLDRFAKVLCRLFDVVSRFAVLRRQIVRDKLEILVVCEHVVSEYRDEHECSRDNEYRAERQPVSPRDAQPHRLKARGFSRAHSRTPARF